MHMTHGGGCGGDTPDHKTEDQGHEYRKVTKAFAGRICFVRHVISLRQNGVRPTPSSYYVDLLRFMRIAEMQSFVAVFRIFTGKLWINTD
jgi:hypothetical protein